MLNVPRPSVLLEFLYLKGLWINMVTRVMECRFFGPQCMENPVLKTYWLFMGLNPNSQRQLCQQIIEVIQSDNPDPVTCVLSFTSSTSWDPAQELLTLREILHQKYDVNFPVFDIAYCIFWYKKNQELKLNRTNLSPPGKKGRFYLTGWWQVWIRNTESTGRKLSMIR